MGEHMRLQLTWWLTALLVVALGWPSWSQSSDWDYLTRDPQGGSFSSYYYKPIPELCVYTAGVGTSLAGTTAHMRGCPQDSEAYLSGTITYGLRWIKSGVPPPSKVWAHVVAQCTWKAVDRNSPNPPTAASGSVGNSFADKVELLWETSGYGTYGYTLTGDRKVLLDVNPTDGTAVIAVNFATEAQCTGSVTTNGDLSVSCQITTLQPCSTPSPADTAGKPVWQCGAMPYHPVKPQFHPINGGAKTGGDPVNLANGKHEYLPEPDITVYNPYGPAVVYLRNFEGIRSDQDGYGTPGLSAGWVDTYDVCLQAWPGSAWQSLTLRYPNGAGESMFPVLDGGQPTGEFTKPTGAPYFATGQRSTTAGQWNWIEITWKDGTVWTFTPAELGDHPKYRLTRITNRVGSYIIIVRDPAKNYRVTSITDDQSPAHTLLAFVYDAEDRLSSVTDIYGRKVVYTFGQVGSDTCLISVSRLGTGSGTPPARHTYGYIPIGMSLKFPHLVSVTSPSPTGSGTSRELVNYDTAANQVTSLVDANGNTTYFDYKYDNGTRVYVMNTQGHTVDQWIENFDVVNGCVATGRTDAKGYCSYMMFEDSANRTLPTQVFNETGCRTMFTYDQFGNVLTMQRPRGTTTAYTYDYDDFPLGRLVSVQEGSKTPTTFTYYEPSGLVHTITSPQPGTTDGSTVTTTFTYDALGNILTKTVPASSDTGTMTTTYNYTTDGEYTQPAKLGQPLTVTDSLGHTTHYRYDERGNVISVKDALGNETNCTYNIADQPVTIISPAGAP